MKLIAVGDNVVDCYLDQQKYYPGGNCVNVAVNARKNGAEEAAYIGIFATDEKAQHIKYALEKEGIDFGLSRTAEGISGQPRVALTDEGDRVFMSGAKNSVQRRFKLQLIEEDLDFIEAFDVCHVSCYSSMESELEKLAKVIDISYDFSNHLELDYIEKVAPFIQYAFFSAADLSEEELNWFVQKLKGFGFKAAALTRGSEPALFISDEKVFEQRLQEIAVVDTMGAGDSLIGGFLVNYINGESMEKAIEKATASAEVTCGFYGGIGYPKEF
ncbi:fructoselysine 6-kinase [Planomicrobium stackebrandtii]|uniref:Fructoselysine 6-kinase n=1 Tax=Planomicrobium stackebrandtii TaxID=253160 RepID=A0ABU0GY24_9BACL|nr:PfkB family carbohydrate kinase [Planomicrobium stackebrandtii]MDQ0429442.1 fructoselysine 6-kinase [Planomicrobium stackebrandtii]